MTIVFLLLGSRVENRNSEPIVEPSTPEPKIRPVWLTYTWELLQTIIMAVVLYVLIDTVLGRVRVENISMQPNLVPGEFILVNKLAYRFSGFHRGDVVVFHYPRNPEEDYIKRVIGLPGETIHIANGVVTVNGNPLKESYIYTPPAYQGTWEVPQGQIFVLGDNRNQSSDSHSWGFVPIENVVGKAIMVYWPLDKAKLLNDTPIVNAAN
ncbi:MAG TPA: signal peptidase I [Anaerolineaceae bacterium]